MLVPPVLDNIRMKTNIFEPKQTLVKLRIYYQVLAFKVSYKLLHASYGCRSMSLVRYVVTMLVLIHADIACLDRIFPNNDVHYNKIIILTCTQSVMRLDLKKSIVPQVTQVTFEKFLRDTKVEETKR